MKHPSRRPVPPLPRRAFLGGAAATLASGGVLERALTAAAADGEKLTVAVIGHTGRGNFGHAMDTLWRDLPGIEIVGVADPDKDGRAAALERLGLSADRGHADYREMLETLRPDLVSVAPRHIDQHRDMAVAAAEAGVKGVYMEKPFCRDLREADEVVEACEKHGMKLALAHRNRYHPALPVVAELVASGRIGQWLELRMRGKEDRRGGGLDLWVLGSHLLNLSHHFTGEALTCSARILHEGRPAVAADVYEGEEGVGPLLGDEIHARFESERGVPVSFDSKRGAGVAEAGFGMHLIGTEGVIDLRMDAEPIAHFLPGNPFSPKSGAREWIPVTSGGIGVPEPVADIRKQVAGHAAPVADLVAAIREGREPLCSARDGRAVVEMTMAVFASHLQDGAAVPLPLEEREHPLAGLG